MVNTELLTALESSLSPATRERVHRAIERIVEVKEKGGKIVVVTGSGPNIHEGVTTLLAELIRKGVVDGIITSSAVISHELAGSLDEVKRFDGTKLGLDAKHLPRGNIFEITIMDDDELKALSREMDIDFELYEKARAIEGNIIIKAAGNMAYPMGLRSERLSVELEAVAKAVGLPLEAVAGLGADEFTMIGAGARHGVPVLVSVTQLVGGGLVGLCIGDAISLKRRSFLIAQMLGSAELIVESGVALTQEIHDGPFETYTGHGIWPYWQGYPTCSLRDKTLVRIDLDPNLELVWEQERAGSKIQEAIEKGLPKTKMTKVPFRMEMSGFARLEGSIPIVGDIGVVWPIIARHVAERLGIDLDFISYPQETEEGKQMRRWIVDNVRPVDRSMIFSKLHDPEAMSTVFKPYQSLEASEK
jgi:hypothetical protein